MMKCDAEGPTVVHVTKLFHTTDAQEFRAFGRVMSGTVRRGQSVKVLGEGYSLEDEEDMVNAVVESLLIDESRWVCRGYHSLLCLHARYTVDIERAGAGNLVLLSGVDASITKTATIVGKDIDDDLYIFKPIRHMTASVLKVAVEPITPSELPKMLDGLRKINKSYPLVTTKVEESGEHIILGTGELYMDCVLHDLRRLFRDAEQEVRLALRSSRLDL
jgi:U5 small nuclear ribonucleoprotein component